jgi:hydrogenase nickel incorporation protein HypB
MTTIDIGRPLLEQNDSDAAALRRRFSRQRLFVINLMSSPGSGKTALLEATLRYLLAAGRPAAALVGDLATDNDARRLARSGAPVQQLVTGQACHLEAKRIEQALAGWSLDGLEFLFIENVGNLVCPAEFDLGEARRVVLLSVTEGEDKPLKYPPIFLTADAVLLTKIDLAAAVEFDRPAAAAAVRAVAPQAALLTTSVREPGGADGWFQWLLTERARWLAATSPAPSLRQDADAHG